MIPTSGFGSRRATGAALSRDRPPQNRYRDNRSWYRYLHRRGMPGSRSPPTGAAPPVPPSPEAYRHSDRRETWWCAPARSPIPPATHRLDLSPWPTVECWWMNPWAPAPQRPRQRFPQSPARYMAGARLPWALPENGAHHRGRWQGIARPRGEIASCARGGLQRGN